MLRVCLCITSFVLIWTQVWKDIWVQLNNQLLLYHVLTKNKIRVNSLSAFFCAALTKTIFHRYLTRVGLHLWYMLSYQLQLECMDPSSVSTVGSLSDSMNDKQQNIMSNANVLPIRNWMHCQKHCQQMQTKPFNIRERHTRRLWTCNVKPSSSVSDDMNRWHSKGNKCKERWRLGSEWWLSIVITDAKEFVF